MRDRVGQRCTGPDLCVRLCGKTACVHGRAVGLEPLLRARGDPICAPVVSPWPAGISISACGNRSTGVENTKLFITW